MADLKFTDKSEQTLKQAFELAEQNSTPQVHPLHLACALWDDATPVPPGGTTTPTLFRSALERAGGDSVSGRTPTWWLTFVWLAVLTTSYSLFYQTLFQRSLLSHTNRIPSQSPPPAPPLPLSQTLHAILRSADSIMKDQRDSYVAIDHLLLALLKSDANELNNVWTDSKVDKAMKTRIETEVKKRRGSRKVDSKNAEEGFDALNKCE
jgi:ATP-dependent Clp protease ATP-binding subunit ClpA